VSNISPAVADELRLDSNVEGVVIIELGDDAPAQGVGFRKGDVILNVNNQKIARTADLERVTKEPARFWRITVLRDGQQISVTLGG
jgi:S1-C subfamily serine protease